MWGYDVNSTYDAARWPRPSVHYKLAWETKIYEESPVHKDPVFKQGLKKGLMPRIIL